MFVIIAGLAVLAAFMAFAHYMRSVSWPSDDDRPPVDYSAVHYVVTESGFRYRLLDADVSDGYDAVVAKLLPDELLYRMEDGDLRVRGELFPVLIQDRISFDQSVEAMNARGWRFKLAAGVPRNLNQEDELLVESRTDGG